MVITEKRAATCEELTRMMELIASVRDFAMGNSTQEEGLVMAMAFVHVAGEIFQSAPAPLRSHFITQAQTYIDDCANGADMHMAPGPSGLQ